MGLDGLHVATLVGAAGPDVQAPGLHHDAAVDGGLGGGRGLFHECFLQGDVDALGIDRFTAGDDVEVPEDEGGSPHAGGRTG